MMYSSRPIIVYGFNGAYQHWSVKHCQKYVNEFAFRLNDGNYQRDTMDRIRAMLRGAVDKRLAYVEFTR